MSGDECRCRPIGFLLGFPFAFVALVISLVGAVIWILGSIVSLVCPYVFRVRDVAGGVSAGAHTVSVSYHHVVHGPDSLLD